MTQAQVPGYPFGTDLNMVYTPDGSGDLDPGMGETSGRTLLVQRCVRRVTTPRGSVVGCPNDCLDLRSFLRAGALTSSTNAIQIAYQQEMQKEQGILSPQVAVTFNVAQQLLTVSFSMQSSYGPLNLTFQLTPTTIAVLLNGLPVGF